MIQGLSSLRNGTRHASLRRRAALGLVNLGLIVMLCAGSQHAAKAEDSGDSHSWKTYSYPADGFSASFSSVPKRDTRNLQTAAGIKEMHIYSATDSGVALTVMVTDVGDVGKEDTERLLEGGKQGALASMQAREISEQKIALGNYPGIELVAETDAFHIIVHFYLVGTKVYQAIVVSPIGEHYGYTTRFLDSLQLIHVSDKGLWQISA